MTNIIKLSAIERVKRAAMMNTQRAIAWRVVARWDSGREVTHLFALKCDAEDLAAWYNKLPNVNADVTNYIV